MQRVLAIKLFILLLFIGISYTTSAQVLSPESEISLLTCGPGEELYATFGHSAIRVNDTTQNIDMVFNYGMFNFNDPNFYSNFVRGKLNYMLGIQPFKNFIFEYRMDERWVYEQILNLTVEERQALFDFLSHNSKPENRYYLYDFLFDNCSSRIRDVLNSVFPNQIIFPDAYNAVVGEPTFRDLLHLYLNKSPWTKLGIDILLGKRVDRVAAASEYMFLPDFLLEAFGKATINSQPLVTQSGYLYQSNETMPTTKALLSPLLIFTALLVFVIVLYILKVQLRWIIFFIFFIVGLLGILLLFMWVGTDHYVTKYNLNLLWAIPTHTVPAFLLLKRQRPRWVLWYFTANALLCVLLLVLQGILPQPLNNALLPFVGMLGFCSYIIAKPLLTELQSKAMRKNL